MSEPRRRPGPACMATVRLTIPDPVRHAEWADLVTSFGGGPIDGSGYSQGSVPDTSEDAFGAYLDHRLGEEEPTREPAPGRVHCSYRWIECGDHLVGFLAIRHGLTSFLYDIGGHIGYSVRPEARRQGVATLALEQGVTEANGLNISPVLVTCHESNIASQRTIERAGGRYENTGDRYRRYGIGEGTPPARPAEL